MLRTFHRTQQYSIIAFNSYHTAKKVDRRLENWTKTRLRSVCLSRMTKFQEETLLVKRLSENATLPVRGSVGAAGYDLARWVCHSWISPWQRSFKRMINHFFSFCLFQCRRSSHSCARQRRRQDWSGYRCSSWNVCSCGSSLWTGSEELHRYRRRRYWRGLPRKRWSRTV